MKRITRKILAMGLCLSMLLQPVYGLAAEETASGAMETQAAEEGESAALPEFASGAAVPEEDPESGILTDEVLSPVSNEESAAAETEQPEEETPAPKDQEAAEQLPGEEENGEEDAAEAVQAPVSESEEPAEEALSGGTSEEVQGDGSYTSAADAIEEMQGLLEEQGLSDEVLETDEVSVESGEPSEESFEAAQDAAGAYNDSAKTGTTDNGVYHSTSGTTVGGITLVNIGTPSSGNPVISAGASVVMKYPGALRWESSDPSIASVSETGGVLVALKKGTVTINAYTSAVSGASPAAHVDLDISGKVTLKLNKSKTTLDASDSAAYFAKKTEKLTATVSVASDSNAYYKNRVLADLYFESSNTGIVQVDDKTGMLEAGNTCGSAIVTCYAAGKLYTCDVLVERPVADIEFEIKKNPDFSDSSKPESYHKLTLEVGDQELVRVNFLPKDNTELKTVSWTSKNTGCAKVDKNGVITAVKPGSTVIVATWTPKDTKVPKQSREVFVKVENPVEKVQILNSKKKQVSLVYLNLAPNSSSSAERLTASLLPANPTGVGANHVTWVSSNPNACIVVGEDMNATVVAQGEGYSTITATCQGIEATVVVRVTHELEAIKTSRTDRSVTIPVGQAYNLYEDIYSEPSEYKTNNSWKLKWTSANKNIVTVEDGVITGVKAGGPVKVTVSSGKISLVMNVTVTKMSSGGLSVDSKNFELKVGGLPRTLTLSRAPGSVVEADVDDDSVVSVKQEESDSEKYLFKVSPLKGGKARIKFTATYENNRKKSLNVVVTVVNPVEKVQIWNNSGEEVTKAELIAGEVLPLKATFSPEDATDVTKTTWKSSNGSVATVDANGVVRAKGPGQCQIYAKIGKSGSKFMTVSVKRPLIDIRLNKTGLNMKKGESSTLKVSYNPSNAENKAVEWISNDSSVATVVNGKVTAAGPGSCVIMVRSLSDGEGKITAACTVNVRVPLKDIFLYGGQNMFVGQSQILEMTTEPYDTTCKLSDTGIEPVWTTTSPNISVVPLTNGQCRVTALSSGSGTKADCTVKCTYSGTARDGTKFNKAKSFKITVYRQ